MSDPTKVKTPATNWEILAGLRFFLAWIVACGHLNHDFLPKDHAFFQFFSLFGGKAAVIGFLLVSGYSISASLHKKTEGFYQRRFLRIYPLYFFAVILALLLEVCLSGKVQVARNIFVSNGWLPNSANLFFCKRF